MDYKSELIEPNETSKLHKFSANARFIGSNGSGDEVWVRGILPWSDGKPVVYGIRRILPMRGGYNYQTFNGEDFNINKIIQRPHGKPIVEVFFTERFPDGGLGRMDIDYDFAEKLFKVPSFTKYSKYTVGDAFEDVSWSSIREITKIGSVVFSKDKRFQINGSGHNNFHIRMFNKSRTRVYIKDLYYNEFWDLHHCTKNITFNFNKDKFLELELNKLFDKSFDIIRTRLLLGINEMYGSTGNFVKNRDSGITLNEFLNKGK